jgi:uncharacterized protein YdeI (YjbR/CyaY-like superfamily)
MPNYDQRFDAYIAKSAPFAQPILKHLRAVVHQACPDVEETLKWSMPHFMYQGMLCGMSAFKAHCAFGFWKGALIVKAGDNKDTQAMGQFGCIKSLKDLPPKKRIAAYVKAAMKLNVDGVKSPLREKRQPRKPLPMPKDLAAALRRNAAARSTFDNFSPSHRRDYIEWITEAKTPATRERRLATTLVWLPEGKTRHWKYQKKPVNQRTA